MIFKSEAKHQEYYLAEMKRLNSEPLKSSEEWQRAMLITGMKPYYKFIPLLNTEIPLLNTEGGLATTLTEFASTIMKGLDDATGDDHK